MPSPPPAQQRADRAGAARQTIAVQPDRESGDLVRASCGTDCRKAKGENTTNHGDLRIDLAFGPFTLRRWTTVSKSVPPPPPLQRAYGGANGAHVRWPAPNTCHASARPSRGHRATPGVPIAQLLRLNPAALPQCRVWVRGCGRWCGHQVGPWERVWRATGAAYGRSQLNPTVTRPCGPQVWCPNRLGFWVAGSGRWRWAGR